MSERVTIPEHLMLSRLAQSEQMREFFSQMWLQNPVLDKQAGGKVHNLLSPLASGYAVISPESSAGITVDIKGDGR